MNQMTTTFALVATHSYRENYAFDNEGNLDAENPYWKSKGTVEKVIATDLSLERVQTIGIAGLEALVNANAPESNDYVQYGRADWELVELNQHLVERVKTFIAEKGDREDLGYIRFCWSSDMGSEFEFDWAVKQAA